MSTYSFNEISASLIGPGGAISLRYVSGNTNEGITIAKAGGNDKSGTITLAYDRKSPVNAQLQALYDAQSLDARLRGRNLITLTNPATGDVTACRSCAFSEVPDLSKNGIMRWVFSASKIDTILGAY